jgi:hypothetical protein
MSLLDLALLAQEGPGRGDDASGIGGVAIIAGIVIVAIIGGLVLHALFVRYGRSKQDGEYRPHQRGRVGRRT